MSIIKDRLKLLMKLLGINLKEFAEISGIPYRTLQNYTLGVREPTIENLQKMANATNCDLHWLITGKGKPFREEPKEQLDPRRLAIIKLVLEMPEEKLDDIYKMLEKEKLLVDLLEEIKRLKKAQ
uniref:XRE family transcriptional regulator n=1 Tax=Hydrogenobacter sp. TaxID=2152829 RepID=A0A7C2V5Z5_9AQUI